MLTIKEASSKKDIKAFIRFANDLYKDNAYYVPDIMSSQIAAFNREENPAYEYCDSKCFLAYKGSRIVGRVAAIHNTKVNAKEGKNQMRFWHADFIDDENVVDMLFKAVEDYAKEKGCTEVYGPMGFSDMDREGMLINGFDQLSMFQTYYNHPYYMRHMERMGYAKNVDWLEYRIIINDVNDERIARLKKLAEAVTRRQKLTLVTVPKKKMLEPYVEKVFKLYNEVYTLYGMVPLTPRQVDYYVKELLPLVDQRTTAIVNAAGDVVAFGIGAPTLSHALRKCGGRMFPFGWYHILKALKGKNDTLDLFLIAVHPDYQDKGVNAIIMNHIVQFGIHNGVMYAETSPELETNTKVQAQWRFFDTQQHKKRRCYIKSIG